jgi:polyphenol oxidase
MTKDSMNGLPVFSFEVFEKYRVKQFVTTREGGVSKNLYASLNLSFNSGDNPENVKINRKILGESLDMDIEKLIFPEQCHSANIKIIHSDKDIYDVKNTDGLITRQKNICLCILAADCVPVLLFDPVRQVIAALHAGWRGTVKQITQKAIRMVTNTFGSNPGDLIAGIGPSISRSNYQVGSEVINAFKNILPGHDKLYTKMDDTGHGYLDLWEANRLILCNAGVLPGRIETAGLCAYDRKELFFSARRDGVECGRFASGIMLK